MKNKLLSALLICAMLVGMLAIIPFSASAATTITVASVDDWMSKLSGKDVGEANIYVTATELDFTGKTLVPVQGFSGTFNGNGVVIKNANIETTGETGLFNCLTGAATFKNFMITDSTFKGKEWVGSVVCCTNGNVTVENVYVSETVNVIAAKNGNNSYAGGLIGGCAGKSDTLTVSISNCVFAGSVSAEGQYVGGLIGSTHNAINVNVSNSVVTGSVPANRNSSRGFFGLCASALKTMTMTNCIYAGGTAGVDYKDIPFFKTSVDTTVTNCYTTSANDDGTVYNNVKHTDEGCGAALVAALDLVGENATVTVEGFTKRAADLMLPTALVTLFGDKLPSTADKYATEHTVTWANEDGTVIATETYKYGETPEYKGETPTKAEDDTYTYHFSKWTPNIVAVTGDTTYTAEFYKERKNIIIEDETETDNNGGDNTAEDVFGTQGTTTDATTEEEGGCASLIGSGAVVLAVVMGGALVIGTKKKEN